MIKWVAVIVFLVCTCGCYFADGGALDYWAYRTNGIPTTVNFSSVAYGAGRFVVASQYSNGPILSSEDGVSWTTRTAPAASFIAKVNYLHDRFIVSASSVALTSSNGVDWARLDLPNVSGVELRGSAYGNGRWVVVGSRWLGGYEYRVVTWTSSDFINWSYWSGTNNVTLRDVAFGNGRFLVVGSEPLVSTDGEHWTPKPPLHFEIRTMTFGQGLFVGSAVGSIVTSQDGETWGVHSNAFPQVFLSRLAYGNGTFIGVGSSNQSQHTIMLSTDGTNWTTQVISPRIGNYFLNGVAYGAGTFVTVGMPHTIAQSASLTIPWVERIQPLPSGGISLDIDGEIGRAYSLEYSVDLQTWDELTAYTNDLPRVRIIDPTADGSTPRFYRSVIR